MHRRLKEKRGKQTNFNTEFRVIVWKAKISREFGGNSRSTTNSGEILAFQQTGP
jgi:hypothetical protein